MASSSSNLADAIPGRRRRRCRRHRRRRRRCLCSYNGVITCFGSVFYRAFPSSRSTPYRFSARPLLYTHNRNPETRQTLCGAGRWYRAAVVKWLWRRRLIPETRVRSPVATHLSTSMNPPVSSLAPDFNSIPVTAIASRKGWLPSPPEPTFRTTCNIHRSPKDVNSRSGQIPMRIYTNTDNCCRRVQGIVLGIGVFYKEVALQLRPEKSECENNTKNLFWHRFGGWWQKMMTLLLYESRRRSENSRLMHSWSLCWRSGRWHDRVRIKPTDPIKWPVSRSHSVRCKVRLHEVDDRLPGSKLPIE